MHLVDAKPKNLGDGGMIGRRKLAAEARRRRGALPLHESVERLHRGVRQVGKHIFRLDQAAALGDRGVDVAFLLDGLARRFRQRPELRQQLRRAARLRLAVVPRDLEPVAAGLRGPEAFGIDRNAGRHPLHIDHAWNRQGGRRVERGDRATSAVSWSGSLMSSVNSAEPFDLIALSRRFTAPSRPINLKADGSLSFGSAGTGCCMAFSANAPKRPSLPEECRMTPFSTVISAAGTFHSVAAALTSMARAAAPTLRICS